MDIIDIFFEIMYHVICAIKDRTGLSVIACKSRAAKTTKRS